MRTRHFPLLAAAVIALAGLASTVTPAGAAPVPPVAVVASDSDQARIDAMSTAIPGMNPARTHIFAQRGYASSGGSGDLVYGGGDLLPEAHLYAIFWGNFGNYGDYVAQIKTFLAHMVCGGSTDCSNPSNSHLNNQYWQSVSKYASAKTIITYDSSTAGTFLDTSAPPKTAPSTSAIINEVAKVLSANGKTTDPKGLYLVFTSTYPKSANYCAWHSAGTINGVRAAVGYEPNLWGVSGCSITYYSGYGGSRTNPTLAANSTASVATHEIYEAMTDPMTSGTGWRDSSGWENGDKCTWYYGIDYQNGYWMQPEYNDGLTINGATNPYGTSATNPCPLFTN